MPSYKVVSSILMQHNSICDMRMTMQLEETVEALMNEGWSCVGGISVAVNEEGTVVQMYQAMIKTSE